MKAFRENAVGVILMLPWIAVEAVLTSVYVSCVMKPVINSIEEKFGW